ncbi:MAG: RNA polymerase sigma-70 factor (ECF subfamily) [Verrucomicrobiales bacterium]|jgi:RNA polymerase sigma-70 factor (ECF subfamily)
MGLQSKETLEFVKLLTGHQSALRGFIVSLMPGSPDVEDVLQDTNVVIWEKMSSFEQGSNFRAWIFAIAKNVALAHFSKLKRDRSPVVSETLARLIADTWYQRENADLASKDIALNYCLQTLDDSELAVVDARYSHHNSLEALAAATKRPAATLRVLLFRVREKLRLCVNKRLGLMEGGRA